MEKIKIGILGAGRGMNIAGNLDLIEDCEIVALCEISEERAAQGIKDFGKEIPVYKDFDEFLELDLDAFYSLYGEEKINTAIKYAKDLKDRYTVLWLYYDLLGGKL